MTHPDHLSDEVLSALVDDQLTPDEVSTAQVHLGTCLACQTRLAEMRALVGLLHALPSIEPPRDFQLGPRLVVDPPNVIRLRRWYAVDRVGAGTLAAAFVFLSVGTLYIGSRPAATPSALVSQVRTAAQTAPETTSADAAPTFAPAARSAAAPAPPAAAAPGQAPSGQPPAPALAKPAAPAAAGAAAQPQAAPTPTTTEPGDQVVAATSVRQLPTQPPTPTLVARVPSPLLSSPVGSPPNDPAAPLRITAALVGILAVLGIFIALLIRRRLQAASPSDLE